VSAFAWLREHLQHLQSSKENPLSESLEVEEEIRSYIEEGLQEHGIGIRHEASARQRANPLVAIAWKIYESLAP
jgi:hypothetical protein